MNISGNWTNNASTSLAGEIRVSGNLQNNSSGTIEVLNANQCNSIQVTGNLVNNGIITGNDLDYQGSGSALVVNKQPTGNANPRLRGGASVGTCPSVDCLEVVEVVDGNFLLRYYIFRCDDIFILDPPFIEEGYEEELISTTVLLVAGGGGGGRGLSAGGGGAGGVKVLTDLPLVPNFPVQVQVGRGGAGAPNANVQGRNGSNSSILGQEALGGGGGGSSSPNANNGRPGGSGGGGAFDNNGVGGPASGANQQARGGGQAGRRGGSDVRAGGGGGGAGQDGGNGNTSNGFTPRDGGNGISIEFLNPISPTFILNAFGGGGGATAQNSGGQTRSSQGGGVGNLRIGGNGNENGQGQNGLPQTGSGGGAGFQRGGSGANGVVVILATFSILPVELQEFTAHYQANHSVLLRWTTTKEWENSHFEIERAINQVREFSTIGEVEGIGYSDSPVTYTYLDEHLPLAGGMAYYRLKQVDFDGGYAYSDVIGVRTFPQQTNGKVWTTYPNPTTGHAFTLDLLNTDAYQDESLQIQLIAPTGKKFAFGGRNIAEISREIGQNIHQLERGVYILEVRWGNKFEIHKISKL